MLWPLTEEKLFRRAIGRNEVAKVSRADVVWFTDCDYMFGMDCLESVVDGIDNYKEETGDCDNVLFYPDWHHISDTHIQGRDMVEERRHLDSLPEIGVTQLPFRMERFPRAIGGIQIVSGKTARSRGYLDNTKWIKPVDPSGGFRDTKEDIRFRKSLPKTYRLRVPNLYRIRHTTTGLNVRKDSNAQETRGVPPKSG